VCDAEERAELKGVMQALCGYGDASLPKDEERSTTMLAPAPHRICRPAVRSDG